ncbi:hypothetical protein [Neotabrizicola sp. VNH66]|uniref:hypothetical protein n=1 Tax=Neotabrizicola sp. VNH66 TaxID=3400918 RepID=UPI003C11515C
MRLSLPILFLLAAAALPAAAEGPAPLRQAAISAELYARGLATGDALLILTAARLRKDLDLRPAEGEADLPLDWQAMLAAAEPLIADDSALQALADDIAAEAPKGVSTGPVYRITALTPGVMDHSLSLDFKGGEYAEVYVEAALGTDLNLSVRDERGNLICADTEGLHVGYCTWTPAADGSFTVTVQADSPAASEYTLMTN